MQAAAAAMPARGRLGAPRLGAVKAKARALGVDEDSLELADDIEDPSGVEVALQIGRNSSGCVWRHSALRAEQQRPRLASQPAA